jgi:dTDP-4-amino-4,6-dideoxygalactose transaminase
VVPEPQARTIRLAKPAVGEEELAEIREVLESGQLTMGPKTVEFEELLAPLAGTTHAVAVSSGTAALHVAVLALGIGPGDEVLVPAYTFPATGNVVALAGATPVLVDVDPVTMNIDPEDAARRVTAKTKAILAVHLFGRPARLEELPEGIPVIEDAAGALGALACFSFHPRKIVTTGEGGAITTNDDGLAERSRSLRHHGWSPSDAYEDMPAPAFNYRISEIEAALGVPQLRRFDELYAAYDRVAAGYTERATASGGWRTSSWSTTATGSWPACARRGSSARSGRTRCTGSRPTATRAPSPGRTPPSSARSRCRCTSGSPTPTSTGWRPSLTRL